MVNWVTKLNTLGFIYGDSIIFELRVSTSNVTITFTTFGPLLDLLVMSLLDLLVIKMGSFTYTVSTEVVRWSTLAIVYVNYPIFYNCTLYKHYVSTIAPFTNFYHSSPFSSKFDTIIVNYLCTL